MHGRQLQTEMQPAKDSIINDQSYPTRKKYTREPYLPQTLFSSSKPL